MKVDAGKEKGAVENKRPSEAGHDDPSSSAANDANGSAVNETPATEAKLTPVQDAPKLWTGLFSKSVAAAAVPSPGHGKQNGTATVDGPTAENGAPAMSGFARSNASSLAEALRSYQVGGVEKIPFIEPRGLINTGNMCYMNSVSICLQSCMNRVTDDMIGAAGTAFLPSFLRLS